MDLYGAFASHYKLAANRPQGTARVRVFTPTTAEHGWSADGHSVVEVVVDSVPALVVASDVALLSVSVPTGGGAQAPPAIGSPPSFRPLNPLTAFDGLSVTGDWKLIIDDHDALQSDGQLLEWCVSITWE